LSAIAGAATPSASVARAATAVVRVARFLSYIVIS
jgi:hypothetical protein